MPNARQTLADFTFADKYARFLPALKRRETWEEAVDRMMNMHHKKYPAEEHQANLDEITKALKKQTILPSMRALQFGGEAILRKEMRLYNCSYSHLDRLRFFQEALWLLLCGCGVGFSVQEHHIAKLPRLNAPSAESKLFSIPDSIEGWADAVGMLVESYTSQSAVTVRFDYSQIRPEGAPISSSSGKAPGPKPLRDSLENMRRVLDEAVSEGGILRPIQAYDIVMHLANCVRAGGIRRSATIALFSPDDQEMVTAKTGNWWRDQPQRALSNNSALFERATASYEDFAALFQSVQQFGEPGFLFAKSKEHGANPCVEISLDPVDHTTGETAWSFCNLTSINLAKIRTKAEFLSAARAAALLGTYQAGYLDVGYLTTASRRVMERDCLLGVSITGMADHRSLAFDVKLLKRAVKVVRRTNAKLAPRLGLVPAARLTTVKPEGSGSLVVQAGNGIHPHHWRQYIRHVEAGSMHNPLVRFFQARIPEAVVPWEGKPDQFKIAFPIDLGQDPDLWLKEETDPIEHLELVRLVQNNWVRPGTNRGDLTHNVSNTIQVPPNRWDDVRDHIWKHREEYAGISLLGTYGDLDYNQPPFLAILSEDQIQAKYGNDPVRATKARAAREFFDLLSKVWPEYLDFRECLEESDQTAGIETIACAGGACTF